jgi:hypothetical protein
MAGAAYRTEVEKEFGSDMADHRVGWFAIDVDHPDNDQYFDVHMATATVGPDGAVIRHQYKDQDGKTTELYSSDDQEGFIALAGVSIIFDKKRTWREQRPEQLTLAIENRDGRSPLVDEAVRILRHGGDSRSPLEQITEKRRWITDTANFMPQIKSEMLTHGLGAYYSVVYYTANILFGHDYYRDNSTLSEVPVESTLLPDSEMKITTELQLAHADTICENLRDQTIEDEAMARNLTVFSDIKAEDVPSAFIASRTLMREYETEIWRAQQDSFTLHGVYLPIGFRPSGRTWPYADAGEADDEKAFGWIIESLKNQDITIAQSQIEKEVRELTQRIEYAQQGAKALGRLLAAEKKADSSNRGDNYR